MTDKHERIVRCPSCDGHGWAEDDFTGEREGCAWCDESGYMYENADGVQRQIPHADYGAVADELERLERDRMRELGYQGEAKPPWQQEVRRGTRGGQHPDERDTPNT